MLQFDFEQSVGWPHDAQHGSLGPLVVHSWRACGRCSSGAAKSGYELYCLIEVSVSSVTLMIASSERSRCGEESRSSRGGTSSPG